MAVDVPELAADAIERDPAAQLLERPDEEHVVTECQAEESDRGENEDHAGQMEVRFEENRDHRPDVTAGADRRAGPESGRELVDEAGRDHERRARSRLPARAGRGRAGERSRAG